MKAIELRGHTRPVNVVKFNFDGDLFFSGGADKKVNMWHTYSGERIGSFETKSAVKTLDITEDSKYLFVGSLEGSLELFETNGGALLGSLKRGTKIKYIELSYGNQQILVVYESYDKSQKNELAIYNVENLIKAIKEGKDIDDKALTPDKLIQMEKYVFTKVSWGLLNKFFYGTTNSGLLLKIDLDGQVIFEVQAHKDDAKSLCFSKDFSLLGTAGNDGCKIFDPENLKVLRVFKQQLPMNSLAISPLITKQLDAKEQKYHCLMGGGIPARETTQSKHGGYELHLCNIMYEEEIGTIAGHYGPCNMLQFFNDGRGFVSAGEEGVLRMFKFDNNYWEFD